MLALDRVSARIGDRAVLHDVSLVVRPGELLALIGPNGAGKSTALAVLAGDLSPSAGSATLDGRALAGWRLDALARRRAVLPQGSGLLFDFPVREVVALGRAPHADRTTAGQDAVIVTAALAMAGLAGFADRCYTALSGGERARVHFARALAQVWDGGEGGAARYLLLDEPIAALDLAHQQQALALAHAWARAGFGVLAVLHDLSLAAQHADRLILLTDGRMLAEGAPVEVLTPGNLATAYGVEVTIYPHPEQGYPLVLPRAPRIDIASRSLTS